MTDLTGKLICYCVYGKYYCKEIDHNRLVFHIFFSIPGRLLQPNTFSSGYWLNLLVQRNLIICWMFFHSKTVLVKIISRAFSNT